MRHIIFIALFMFSTLAFSQKLAKNDKSAYNKATDFFNSEDFFNSRVILEDLVKRYPDHFEINYYLGACYLNTRYQKDKAIPYLVKAVEKGENYIPAIVHKDLGDIYHLTYQFDKAISHYEKYTVTEEKFGMYLDHAKRMIQTCINAKILIADTLDVSIENGGNIINSENSEFAPFISADDSILFFAAKKFYTDEELQSTKLPDTVSHLYTSHKVQGEWSTPRKLEITGVDISKGVSIAGLSPDGEYVYINADNYGNQDIYVARYLNDGTLNFEPLPKPINSPYYEGKVTLSPDGNTIYFSSDRSGGLGGKDIYKSERIDENTWGEPQNMGAEINTPSDEDAPFIHPGGRIFYFSSKGHNAIGGYDIFNSLLTPERIFPAENMGFPINTPSDDMFFTLSGSGKYAYFSSAFGNRYGNHDIYRVEMNLNIPLTIIKGTIKAGDPPVPVAAKIRIIHGRTNNKMKYVYNPNPKTGRYLLILPPGTDYTMIIESENFMPQNIQLQIPNQQDFYELFQSIRLKPVVSMGKQVGEQLLISNSFDDTEPIKKEEIAEEAGAVNEKNYDELFELIDLIISHTDSVDSEVLEKRGIDDNVIKSTDETLTQEEEASKYNNLMSLVEEAFDLGDTTKLNKIQENTIVPDKFEQVFIYSEKEDNNNKKQVIVGNDTIYTAPEIFTFAESTDEKIIKNDLMGINKKVVQKTEVKEKVKITKEDIRKSKPEDRVTVLSYTVYFNVNSHTGHDSIQNHITDIARLLVNNETLGFIVSGYSDVTGNADYNYDLSKKRIIWFLEQLEVYSVDTNRGIKYNHGEAKSTEEVASSTDRRIDIEIFKLKTDNTYVE